MVDLGFEKVGSKFEIQCDFQDRVMQVLDLHNTCLLEIIYCSNMNMF